VYTGHVAISAVARRAVARAVRRVPLPAPLPAVRVAARVVAAARAVAVVLLPALTPHVPWAEELLPQRLTESGVRRAIDICRVILRQSRGTVRVLPPHVTFVIGRISQLAGAAMRGTTFARRIMAIATMGVIIVLVPNRTLQPRLFCQTVML